jgi:hypothetical protein
MAAPACGGINHKKTFTLYLHFTRLKKAAGVPAGSIFKKSAPFIHQSVNRYKSSKKGRQ